MLSLIIPCYNEEGAIEDIVKRCDAVLRDEDEIIVVNDGSTDGTSEILNNMNIERLRVVSHKKNTGNGASIMTGLSNARGEWIATIDADEFEKLMVEDLEIRHFGNSVLRNELMQKVQKEIALASLKGK
ncbi:MAG: glycosyltransferase family 2 protein, partial [Candidatus Peribacteraceae bacterium]|nr:glycosyltransferase family 2 protein [Candidatus Peribacteraceae bacterium]